MSKIVSGRIECMYYENRIDEPDYIVYLETDDGTEYRDETVHSSHYSAERILKSRIGKSNHSLDWDRWYIVLHQE